MPLTPEEQQELAALNNRAGISGVPVAGTKLTIDEQAELDQLNARAGANQPALGNEGQSTVASRPLTEQEQANAVFDQWLATQPGPTKPRSKVPQAFGATAGSLAFERTAAQATRGMPPAVQMAARGGAALVGAGVGAMGGKGLQQVTTGDIGSLNEIYGIQGQLGAAKEEVINEVIGMGTGNLLGRALSGGFAKKHLLPGMERLSRKLTSAGTRTAGTQVSPATRKLLRSEGAGLTGGMRGESFLGRLEGFIKGSYVGGGKLKRISNEANPEALRVLAKETVDAYWNEAGSRVSKDELASTVADSVERKSRAFKQDFATQLLGGKRPLDPVDIGSKVQAAREAVSASNKTKVTRAYDRVKEIASRAGIADMERGDIVPLTNAFKQAEGIRKRWENRGPSALRTQMLDLADVILEGPAKTDFANADVGLRSQLLAESRKLDVVGTRTKNPTMTAALKQMQDAIDADLSFAANKFDPAIKEALDTARGVARENIQFEEMPFVRNITKLYESESPEKLISAIFTNGSPKRIDLAIRALGQDTVSELADTWLNKTVADSMDAKASIGASLKTKLDNMGEESLLSMFGREKVDDLYAVAKIFENRGQQFIERGTTRAAVKVANENPDVLASRIFQKNNVKGLKRWKAELPPVTYKRLLASWIEDGMKNKGKSLQKILDDTGPEMLKEMIPTPSHLRDLKDIARLENIVSRHSGYEGAILAPLMEAGALAGLATQPGKALQRGAGTMLSGLGITGLVLTNKRSAKWIAMGVKNPHKMRFYTQKAIAELVRHTKAETLKAKKQENLEKYPDLKGIGAFGF